MKSTRPFFSGRTLARWLGLAAAVLFGVQQSSAGGRVVYSTHFETAEGYNASLDLAGQNGWTNAGSGGNGLLQGYSGYGQSAYIGFGPPAPYNGLYLWHRISPSFTNYPQLTFTVDLAFVDSTNAFSDEFLWSVYNTAGVPLFSLDFFSIDPGYWDIYYAQDNETTNRYTGWWIVSGNAFSLRMTMNFPSNRWDAWLGGVQVVSNAVITATNALKTLGDVDAVWLPDSTVSAGNNYMIFDNYAITADVPQLDPPVFLAGGQHRIRVNGPNGLRCSLDASTNLVNWTALKTNVITGGYFDHTNATAGKPQQFYRARWVP